VTLPPGPRVVRSTQLIVDTLSDGRLRFRSPAAVGFASAGRLPAEVGLAVRRALAEILRAEDCATRSMPYDLAKLTERKDRL
jgi:hypothetical protein